MALLLLLAGCGGRERSPPPPLVAAPDLTGRACVAALDQLGVALRPWRPESRDCRVDTPVMASGDRPRLRPALRTSCRLLYRWALFEPEIDRLARRLLGSGLRSVQHYGSFSCRRMTGNGARLSLHASAQAIDVAAFVLDDGRRIAVATDWGRRGALATFLRAVAFAGCRRFSAVLTPNTDRLHGDHIHFDLGPWRVCDA